MKNIALNLLQKEDGVTSSEYAIISSLIAVGIIAAVAALGGSVSGLFQRLTDSYP